MGKAKVKVKVRNGKSGTVIASGKVAVSPTEQSQQKRRLFQTKAEIVTHLNRESRPSTFKPRRTR